jgi:hypothetical protein
MEDGHRLVTAQVCTAVMGQEAIDLPLALELGAEALRVDRFSEPEWILRLRQIQILETHNAQLIICQISFK